MNFRVLGAAVAALAVGGALMIAAPGQRTQSRNLLRRPASRAAHAIKTRRAPGHSRRLELPSRQMATSCRKRNKRNEKGRGVLAALEILDSGA